MNRPFIIAAIGVIVVVVAIALNYMPGPTEEAARPAVTEQTQKSSSSSPEEKNSPSAEKKTPPNTKTEKPVPPSFDVVRVNPNGDTVMAGRAAPDSAIEIIDDGAKLGSVKTDSRGEWVFVPERPMAPGKHKLSLKMKTTEEAPVKSTSDVMVMVPEQGKDIAGQTGDGQALALKIGPDGKATVLQKPGRSVGGTLTVDAVDYNDKGQLFISGHADPNAAVQLYLNNRFIGHARADEDDGSGGGPWTVSPQKPVAPGLYMLRADQVDNTGKVLARVEFPFSRAEQLTETALKKGDYVIVQPGNSLWRLARRTYGEGPRYTVIYQANKDQIVNPDLIYPGQRFKLPDTK